MNRLAALIVTVLHLMLASANPVEAREQCDAEWVAGAVIECVIEHDGAMRDFRVHLPSRAGSRPAPLVISLHGGLMNKTTQEEFTAMGAEGAGRGFIVVHPNGLDGVTDPAAAAFPDREISARGWNAGEVYGCCGTARTFAVDDSAFLTALLDHIGAHTRVDSRRVYVAGFSAGGMMAHRMACEAADRITAIASVAGPLVLSRCQPTRPVGVLQIHGTADLVVPYNGDSRYRSAHSTAREWSERNGGVDSVRVSYTRGDSNCARFEALPPDAPVELCTVQGGGHTWPGAESVPLGEQPTSGHTTQDLDATDHILDFFDMIGDGSLHGTDAS